MLYFILKDSLGFGSGWHWLPLGAMTRISHSLGPTEAVDKLAVSSVALPEVTFSSGCPLGEKLRQT